MAANVNMDRFFNRWFPDRCFTFTTFVNGNFTTTEEMTPITEPELKTLSEVSLEASADWKIVTIIPVYFQKFAEAFESNFGLFELISSQAYGPVILRDYPHLVSSFDYYSRLPRDVQEMKKYTDPCSVACFILDDTSIILALSWLVVPTLAAGSSVTLIVKHSFAYLAFCFATLLTDVGLPPGLINVVPYYENEDLSKYQNRFSKYMGILPEEMSKTLKLPFDKLLLGKPASCPVLVLKSADLESAVDSIIKSIQNTDVPWYPNVIYVEEAVFKKFSKFFIDTIDHHSCDSFIEGKGNTTIGDIGKEHFQSLAAKGYEVVKVHFPRAVCLVVVNHDDALNTPRIDAGDDVLTMISVLSVKNVKDGIVTVNKRAGLAVSLWSNSADEVFSIPNKLECGMVWVNCINQYSPDVPFMPWPSYGHGIFSGVGAVISSLKPISIKKIEPDYSILQAYTQYSFSSYKLPASSASQMIPMKPNVKERAAHLVNLADRIDLIHKSVTNVEESIWEPSAQNLRLWSNYWCSTMYESSLIQKDSFQVLCSVVPVGTVGILVGSMTFDVVMYLVGAAFIHGNQVVIGLSQDLERSQLYEILMNSLFCAQATLVKMMLEPTAAELRARLVAAVDVVWCDADEKNLPSSGKKFVRLSPMRKIWSSLVTHNAFRQQSVWIATS